MLIILFYFFFFQMKYTFIMKMLCSAFYFAFCAQHVLLKPCGCGKWGQTGISGLPLAFVTSGPRKFGCVGCRWQRWWCAGQVLYFWRAVVQGGINSLEASMIVICTMGGILQAAQWAFILEISVPESWMQFDKRETIQSY